jgi:hypothetical protein
MGFEVFTAMTIMMMFFWVLAQCGLAGRSQHFGEVYFRAEVTMPGIRGIIQGGRKGSLKERVNQDGVR